MENKLLLFGAGTLVVGGGLLVADALIDTAPRSARPAMPWTKSDFISTMTDAINAGVSGLSDVTVQLLVAHAAYESGWGRSAGYRKGNNAWNITAGSRWTGPTVNGPDAECQANGTCVPITQAWRAYPDLSSAAADYWAFLNATSPDAVQGVTNGDPSWVFALRSRAEGGSGYYTLPSDQYAANYQGVLSSVQAA